MQNSIIEYSFQAATRQTLFMICHMNHKTLRVIFILLMLTSLFSNDNNFSSFVMLCYEFETNYFDTIEKQFDKCLTVLFAILVDYNVTTICTRCIPLWRPLVICCKPGLVRCISCRLHFNLIIIIPPLSIRDSACQSHFNVSY